MSESHEPPQSRGPLHLVESRVSRTRDEQSPTHDETVSSSDVEPRMLAAWHEWLAALASDADAALAAADLYAGLAPAARDAWLDALAEDGPSLSVPLLALYAPLLGVETDVERRARMEVAVALGGDGLGRGHVLEVPVARAFAGMTSTGARVVALIQPVYLQFVRVLWCRFVPDEGIFWARQDSLLANANAPKSGDVVDGVVIDKAPMAPIVEELAHAILAHGRSGLELPNSLRDFADLFDTDVDAIDGPV